MWLQRYGSTPTVIVLGIGAVIFLVAQSWILFAIFLVAWAGALFVRSVRRQTGR